MIVNGTCINTTNGRVGATFVNVWTGLSSLVAVIWLGRSMYKQREFSQPKFVALAVCFSDLMYSGKKIKMKNKKTVRNFFFGLILFGFRGYPLNYEWSFPKKSETLFIHFSYHLMNEITFHRIFLRIHETLTTRVCLHGTYDLHLYTVWRYILKWLYKWIFM